MEGDSGRALTRWEFDAVIQRAAELAADDPDSAPGALTEGDLFRIAGEVGLPESHVRRALAEVRSGEQGGGLLDRFFGPQVVRTSRVVPGKLEEIADELDEFLVASQLLQRVRRGSSVLQYRPAVDWASQVARAASFSSSKYYTASAKSVEVRLSQVDDARTLVEIEIDPGIRQDDVVGALLGGGVGGGATGVAAGFGLALVSPLGLAVGVGGVVGLGVWYGIAYASGQAHRKKRQDVLVELEGILDALELGDPSSRRHLLGDGG